MNIGMDHIAEDHMSHLFRFDPRAFDRFADNGGAQFSRWLVLQTSAKVSNGGAHTAQDDNFWLFHMLSSPSDVGALLAGAHLLLEVSSTIHAECRASIIIPIQDEVANSTGNLPRRADTTERYTSQDRLLRLLRNRLIHVRPYIAGTDGVDRNVEACQLRGCRFGETNDASFRCCIVGLAKTRRLAIHR